MQCMRGVSFSREFVVGDTVSKEVTCRERDKEILKSSVEENILIPITHPKVKQ